MAYNSEILWIQAVFTVAYQLTFFCIAFTCKFDKVTDLAGGSNFAINALIGFILSATYSSKSIVIFICLIVWAVRLSSFLLIRVLKSGEDNRFDGMREHFFKFLGFWVFQMIWVYAGGLSVNLFFASGDSSAFGSASDIAGLILFIVGFLAEAVSDQQKFYYRFNTLPAFKSANPDKTAPVFRVGLWNYSRQPNYFGEILLWWGFFLMCLHAGPKTYISLISPFVTSVILMGLSGIPLSEKGAQERYLSAKNKDPEARKEYLEYRNSTSPLIPLPKSFYRALPLFVKRVFLFEWSMYEGKYLKDSRKVGDLESSSQLSTNNNDSPASG